MSENALAIKSRDQMQGYAKVVIASGLAPASFRTEAQVHVAFQSGLEMGLTPMKSLDAFCVINGKASLYGDAPLALVLQSGLLKAKKEWIEGEKDGRVAHCETLREGIAEPARSSFSVKDAILAGLWNKKGPWTLYPDRMLQMRARSRNLRDNFADCLWGKPIAEEYMGMEPERQPGPDAGGRIEVENEDVTPVDTAQSLKDQLGQLISWFRGEVALQLADEPGEVDEAIFLKGFQRMVADIMDDQMDYTTSNNYDQGVIDSVKAYTENTGIPASILEMLKGGDDAEE